LEGFVESDHDSQLSSIVGNSTHEPVSGRLPHGVKESEKDVQEHSSNISFIEDIDALETRCVTGVLDLVKVPPDMCDENHDHKNGHTAEGTGASSVPTVIEDEAHADSAKDLRCPVDETVERTTSKGEEGAVEIIELPCVEVVRAIEHGEEEQDHGVSRQSEVQAV